MKMLDIEIGDIANASRVYHVQWSELPASCPMPAKELWNSHPRVYLPLHECGLKQCPYCSAVYILDDMEIDAPAPHFHSKEIERAYHRRVNQLRLAGQHRRPELDRSSQPPPARSHCATPLRS